MKKWLVNDRPADMAEMKSQFGAFLGELLCCKGIRSMEKAQEFFACNALSDPYLMRDMEQAVEIITNALDEGRKITVFGDYDCDGVTSTAMLFSFLQANGADVDYYIPTRTEGYGMNSEAVQRIIEGGTELIITVDNGISAFKEAEYIKEQGVQLVITDHHQPQEDIPLCDACVNPHRSDDNSPCKNLCGAGVVLKLLCALAEDEEFVMAEYADLAAIGTIGDVMPLTGENRYIVRRGLESLRQNQNIGIEQLLRSAKVSADRINSTGVAFYICPRINAAGRIESADKAIRLLLAETHDTAALLAEELELLNTQRKSLETDILNEVKQQIEDNPRILTERIIIIAGRGWSHGVVGLVCTRLLERYGKPVFVMGIENGEARGSARGIEGFSVFRLLEGCSDLLTKFGGHPKAGGFSMADDKIQEFTRRAYDYCREHYPKMPSHTAEADMEIDFRRLTVENVKEISKLEPFGEGNKTPVFMLRNCLVTGKRSLKDGKYTSIEVQSDRITLKAVTFSVPFAEFAANIGDTVDIMATAEINEYNGTTSVNLKLLEIRPSAFNEDRFFAAQRVYEEIVRGEGCDSRLLPRIIPDRESLKKIYDLVRTKGAVMSAEDMSVYGGDINYCMLRITLDAFAEAGMVRLSPNAQRSELIPTKEKHDLFAKGILADLKNAAEVKA